MTRQMTSRFASKCLNCPVKIQADEQINYTPGVGSSHVVCPQVVAQVAPIFASADPDYDMYLSEQEMDRDDASYLAWLAFSTVPSFNCEHGKSNHCPAFTSKPQNISVEDSGVYVMPDGSIVKVQANREKTRTYAKRWTVIPGIRLTEAGSKEHGEYVYEPSLVQEVAQVGRKMSLEEAKAFILRYGQCARCSRQLKDANSVERGLGPVCIKYFSMGTTAADLMVAA